MSLLSAFCLPQSFQLKQRLPKKVFYENAQLSSAAQKLLQDEVEALYLVAQVTPSNSNIPVFKTEKHEYLELLLIEIQLKNDQAWSNLSPNSSQNLTTNQLKKLHELVHKAIPYPLVVLINSGTHTQISLAEKFINQADTQNDKLILGELHATAWLDLKHSPVQETADNNPLQAFISSLKYSQLNHQNLYLLYQSILARVTAHQLAQATGYFKLPDQPQNIEQQRIQLKQIQTLEKSITETKNKMAECQQFNEKVAFNMQLQKLQSELKKVTEG